MTTPPLVDLPSTFCIASVTVNLEFTTGISASEFSGAEQGFEWPRQLWSADFTFPPIRTREKAAPWIAFGGQLRGRFGRFLMGIPGHEQPLGAATGTPVVDGANQTGSSLATRGWTPNTPGIMLAGDAIQLGSGLSSRLHVLLEDADSDAEGKAVLSVAPDLRTSPADGAAIVVDNARGVFRMKEDIFSWSLEPGKIYRFVFGAVEVPNA